MSLSGHVHPETLTLPEAARVLSVSERTVRRWIKAGRLPAKRRTTAQGHFRIRRSDVEAARAVLLALVD